MRALRLTRVRSVPLAGEALRFGELVGGHETCKGVAGVSRNLPFFTGLSRRGNVPPHMRLRHCQVVDERRFSSWALSARARSAGARHFVPHAQGARSH